MHKELSPEERERIFKSTIQAVNKQFGMGSSQILGENKVAKLERVSSGSIKLDEAIGGGFPKGRIIEVYGPESSGKTTVALHAVAEHQAQGGLAVYVDAEHALDLNYARDLNVDVQNLVLSQPDTAEDTLDIVEMWIRSGVISIIVVDSVASLVPKAELNGSAGDNSVGLLARLMSKSLRKMAKLAQQTGTTVIFINQIREKVGVMFGNPETTPGGRALKFTASIRLDVRTQQIDKKDGLPMSKKTKIKVVKSKVSTPHREVEVDIEFGRGISLEGEIADFGADLGVLRKSGAWFYYGEDKWQGRDNFKLALVESPELKQELREKIVSMLSPIEEEVDEPLNFDDVEDDELEEVDEVVGEE